jgi:DNA-binding transcriptional MocR family regulator
MRIVSPWKPRLEEVDGPASERLIEALAADILSNQLEDGARLPAHRDVAWKLKVSVGTVTKAYRVLQRRGLIESTKGSGTFVIGRRRPQGPVIDLSVNAPPAMLNERVLSTTLTMAARKVESFYFLNYPPPAGHERHRMLLAGLAALVLTQTLASFCSPAVPNRLWLLPLQHQAAQAVLSSPSA